MILDTSVLIGLQRKQKEIIETVRKLEYEESFAITFINKFEFLYGIQRQNVRKKEESITFLNQFLVLGASERTSEILTELKFKYDQKGISLSLTDLLIASIALENRKRVITSDKDFQKIEELDIVLL